MSTQKLFIREDIKKEYNSMLRKFCPDKGDIGFSWIQHLSNFSLYNWKEIVPQVREWRKINVKALEYNNKEYEIDGRKWYVLIAQPYKDGEMEECGMCPVSALLFGTMVNGYTYAFAKERDRDVAFAMLIPESETLFESLEISMAEIETKSKKPLVCVLCKKPCENEFGNSAYPLVKYNCTDRCCDECNHRVMQARFEGVFRCEDIETDEDRKRVLDQCHQITTHSVNTCFNFKPKVKTPNELLGDILKSQFFDRPDIKAIASNVEVLQEQYNAFKNNDIEIYMGFVTTRFQRILETCITSSPKEICSSAIIVTDDIEGRNQWLDLEKPMVLRQILTETIRLQQDFLDATDAYRKIIADELARTELQTYKQEDKKKNKVEKQQGQTRQANKSKSEEKRHKEESDRKAAIAEAHRAEQQQKKQQAIARKKREEKIKQSQLLLARLNL
jgi:hypothetical protein